jgi:hypothetical protein
MIIFIAYIFIYLHTHKACRNKSNDQKDNTYIQMSVGQWPKYKI